MTIDAAMTASTLAEPLPFAQLYPRFAPFVRGVLTRQRVSAADLDDLTQEVFLTLHRKDACFADERALRAWLFQAARRVASNAHRARVRADRRWQSVRHDEMWRPTPVPSPDAWVAQREGYATLHGFIQQLPPHERELFELSEVQGLSAPEVARQTATKLNTTYSRIRRLRQRWASKALLLAVLLMVAVLSVLSPTCATMTASPSTVSQVTPSYTVGGWLDDRHAPVSRPAQRHG